MTTKILLVDDHQLADHQLFCGDLRLILLRQPDLEVVGEAKDRTEAVELASRLRPDIVVLDIGVADKNGFEAAKSILKASTGTRAIVLSVLSDASSVSRMLQAGALGYVLKDCAEDDLLDALREVSEGKFYLSPAVVGVVLKDYLQRLPVSGSTAASVLSPKEREVLQLIVEGDSTKQIALKLGSSVKTVETHRKRLMDKLGIDSIAVLTKFALREGLTQE